ncbi:hypothetical protein [Nocardia asiatica]|uniref:hypothetical protein n=1 Tax=Nocardia asiatica TaxID=209252 RepID=UPI003EE1E617
MATPASLFRPNGPTRLDTTGPAPDPEASQPVMSMLVTDMTAPPKPDEVDGAIEFEARVPPSGNLTLLQGRQQLHMRQGMVGRTVTLWTNLRSIHILLDRQVIRAVASRLHPANLQHLRMR